MEKIKISIVVPIYNTEPFLRLCLESLCRLDEKCLEFILVNDGSTDNSELICKEFQELDSRFLYLSQNNMGLSSARNTGMRSATGIYVGFLDSDDFVEPNFSSTLLKAINRNPVDIIGFNHFYLKNGVKEKVNSCFPKERLLEKPEILEYLKNSTWNQALIFVWNRIFKRDWLIENHVWFDEAVSLFEDKTFNAKAILASQEQYHLNEFLINYVFFQNSLSQSVYKPYLLKRYEAQFHSLVSIYTEYGVIELPGFAEDLATNYVGHAFLMQINSLFYGHKSMVTGMIEMRNSDIYKFSFAHFKSDPRFSSFVKILILLFKHRQFRMVSFLFKLSKALR